MKINKITNKKNILYIIQASPKRTYKEKAYAKEEDKNDWAIVVSDVIEEFGNIFGEVVEYRPIDFTEEYLQGRIELWKEIEGKN